MKAILFRGIGEPLVVETVPDPAPMNQEVIIKVSRCGVCGTDLHTTSGHGYPIKTGDQLGHEYAGEIVAIGNAVTSHHVGDWVAGLPVLGCGQCESCRAGLDVLCPRMVTYGQGLAQYARLDARAAILLPKTLLLEDGALVEPFAVGRRAVRVAKPAVDTRVLVIGPGPIGLAVTFWLRRAGVRKIAILASTSRRQKLAELMGADHFILDGESAGGEIERALGGAPQLVFEAAGVPGVVARAVDLVCARGTIVALGFCMSAEPIIPAVALMKDLTLRFSVTYTREDYADCAAALIEQGERARSMVTRTVSLEEFPAHFESFRKGSIGGGKLLMDPWAT